MIRAGNLEEISRQSGQWAFVNLGFAEKARSCGLVVDDGDPAELTFSGLLNQVSRLVQAGRAPLNLVIEAPLSAAFTRAGNPTGRTIERRGAQTRYWYVGLGCSVLVAATYLLRSIEEEKSPREIRLFEGLVSFKPKGTKSSHTEDVLGLRSVAWGTAPDAGRLIAPDQLRTSQEHRIVSAFRVAGMDYGVPPVIIVGH